jgi:hypothetical protein
MLLKTYPKNEVVNMTKHVPAIETRFANNGAMKGIFMALICMALLVPVRSFGQNTDDDKDGSNVETMSGKSIKKEMKKERAEPVYPKVVGYLSFILPLDVWQGGTSTTDFTSYTSIGFPIGVNVLYSKRFGFSYEFTPTIKTTNGQGKMSNLLFDPGPMFRFGHGFTFIPRFAFETSGRFGVTPVFNEVYLRTKDVNYFVALSLPYRVGTDDGVQQPGSIGLNLQIGFIFN